MTKYTFTFTFKVRSINIRENRRDIAEIQATRHKTKTSKWYRRYVRMALPAAGKIHIVLPHPGGLFHHKE
jgi:predicted DNA binding CopG/RHH family protein